MKPDDVIARLKPLAKPGNPWFGSAGELVAMAYLKQGKRDLAGPLFASIAKDENAPKSMRSRARQMAGMLGYRRGRRRRPGPGRAASDKVRAGRLGTMTDTMMNRRLYSQLIRRAGTAVVLAALLAGCGAIGGKHARSTPTIGNRTPILSHITNDADPDPTLASVEVVLPPAQVNTDWEHRGRQCLRRTPGHVALGNAPQHIWTIGIAGSSPKQRLAAAPVVGNGTLYVVDTEGTVNAFDAATGGKRWSYPLGVAKDLRSSAFGGGVTYFDGKVYATSGAGDVVALDAATGVQKWRVKPAGPLRGSPTVAFNAVYAMTQDNQIVALDVNDGHQLWEDAAASGEQGVFGVAAPAAAQGSVIAGYSTGELVAYRYENGRVLWSDALARTSISTSVSTLTDVDADPIIDNGRVYALGQGGRMAAYELVTGQRIWELSLAGISTPVIAGEWIFTLTDDGRHAGDCPFDRHA